MKYDNLLKTLFYETMPGLLRAMGCAPIAEYMTVDFPSRPSLVADVVARLADGKVLHLEFQLANDPRMRWRCFHYYGTIQELWEDAEIIQVVIYLGNGQMTMEREIRKPNCRYTYQLLDIRRFEAEVFLESPNDAERVLALLCESTDPRETIRRVLVSWRHLSDKVLLENLDRLRTLSQLRGREIMAVQEIKEMPFDLDISESIVFKMGEAGLLTRQLENLFGPLPETAKQRLAEASKAEIETWAIRALRADSLADVFTE